MAEYEMPIEEQIKLLAKEMRAGFKAVEERFDNVDARFDKVDARLETLQMLGEETKAIAKRGLEGIEGLRESTDAKFEDARKASAEQTQLLKSLFVHVRKRVEVIERPKTRRR